MEQKPEIPYDDFAKLDIRIGEVTAAELVPETDKLIKCTVQFGDDIGQRTIVSGIAEYVAPEALIGKKLPYIVNLAPRTIRGIESQGMLLALSYGDDGFALLEPSPGTPAGTAIK